MPERQRILLSRAFVLCLLTLGSSRPAAAQAERGFVSWVFRDEAGEHKYTVFVPHNYTADRAGPVILYLHGATERGSDGRVQLEVGLGPAVRAREKTFPFITIFPQCEDRDTSARRGWMPGTPDATRALAMLAEVEATYHTDPDRVILTGNSMGGYATWAIAAGDPGRWAAIVPICGGGDPAWAEKLAPLATWAFHGADDRAVSPRESRDMIDAIKRAGGSPRYTEFPRVAHQAWEPGYDSDELFTWLAAQRRGQKPVEPPGTAAPIIRSAFYGPAASNSRARAPFVAVLEVSRAFVVRLGRDMLEAIGDSAPHVLSPDLVSGKLGDVRATTTAEGRSFDVHMQSLSYRGALNRVAIEPRDGGRLAITLGVRNVNLIVQRTSISGGSRSAECGPLRIVLGHRADLPIGIDVEPYVDDRRLRFKLIATRFKLPRDNWSVGRPEWINAHGLFMTEDRVASGLQEGLYSDPGRIEREVIAAVPRMIEQLEEQLDFGRVDDIIDSFWPLPVYRPRVRAWPAEIRTDATGVTLVLGLSASAPDEHPLETPAPPKVVELPPIDTAVALGGSQFKFAMATGLMEPLAATLTERDLARVLVLDLPMKKLETLADARALADYVPDLKTRGDAAIRSELVMLAPLRMNRADSDAGPLLELEFPRAAIQIAVRPRPDSKEWQPYLEIEFRLRQRAKLDVRSPTPSKRVLALEWQGEAQIDLLAHFAPGATPSDKTIDEKRLLELFKDGWREWTESGSLADVPLDDLDLGFSKLRQESLGWDGNYLAATFAPAGLVIRNTSGQPVKYEVKGPHSHWGGPYALDADGEHRYPISYPVTCRFRTKSAEKLYTLPPGQRFEFSLRDSGELELFQSKDEPPPSN